MTMLHLHPLLQLSGKGSDMVAIAPGDSIFRSNFYGLNMAMKSDGSVVSGGGDYTGRLNTPLLSAGTRPAFL